MSYKGYYPDRKKPQAKAHDATLALFISLSFIFDILPQIYLWEYVNFIF